MKTRFSRFVHALRTHMQLKQAEFGDRLGVTQSTVSRWESGGDDPGLAMSNAVRELARQVGFDASPYVDAAGQFIRDETPIVGHTTDAAEIVPEQPPSATASPPGLSRHAEAVRIKGNALGPSYRDGAIVFYDDSVDPEAMIGRECVIHLTDGRHFLRILSRGSSPGLYNLLSTVGGPPVLDVAVESVSPIVWHKTPL